MRRLALLPALVAFILNPSACSQASDPEFQYGAEELRAAVEGTWDLTLTADSGATAALALTFKQGAAAGHARNDQFRGPVLLREAHACGTRTLIKSAAACVDATDMPLDVAFESGDTALDGATLWDEARGASSLAGNFRVYSLIFTQGELDLTLGDVRVTAQLRDDGTVTSAGLAGMRGTATLQRR